MKSFLMFAFLVVIKVIVAQNYDPNTMKIQYDDYSFKDKEYVFEENFSDNRHMWALASTNQYSNKIENNALIVKSNEAELIHSVVANQTIDTERDFELEVFFLKRNSSDRKAAYGLIFGAGNDGMPALSFLLSSSKYSLQYLGEQDELLVPWSYPSRTDINTYGNKLTLRKIKNYLYLYINGFLEASLPFDERAKENFGFIVSKKQEIWVDWVALSYLKDNHLPEKPGSCTLDESQYYIYDACTANDKTIIFNDDFNYNANDWPEGNPNLQYQRINSGKYSIINTNKAKDSNQASIRFDCPLSTIPIEIATYRNFEIEAQIIVTNTPRVSNATYENYYNGLIFGADELGEGYYFGVDQNGFAKVEELGILGVSEYIEPEPATVYKEGQINLLTIRKFDHHYYFFLNKKFVGAAGYISFKQNHIGFRVEFESSILVESLTISYLN